MAGFTATNVKGYEIISEINEGDRHLVSVGNKQCEVEILKQVSNSDDGQLEFNMQPEEARILEHEMPEDYSVIDKLAAVSAPVPNCNEPPAVNTFTLRKSAEASQRNSQQGASATKHAAHLDVQKLDPNNGYNAASNNQTYDSIQTQPMSYGRQNPYY